MKAKMNEDLCRDIAETNRRARSRKSSEHLKETRERRRKAAKTNTEARRKKAVAEAKAKANENARAREKKAAEAAEAKARASAKAAKASERAETKAAKAKVKEARYKDRRSTALGWDCVRSNTVTSSKKERFNSCERRPGGKYGSRGQSSTPKFRTRLFVLE